MVSSWYLLFQEFDPLVTRPLSDHLHYSTNVLNDHFNRIGLLYFILAWLGLDIGYLGRNVDCIFKYLLYHCENLRLCLG